MNLRIQELAEQAGFNHMGISLVIGIEEYHQKFAELIVRECIDTISDCSIEYCTRPQIVNEIKEHFGVK